MVVLPVQCETETISEDLDLKGASVILAWPDFNFYKYAIDNIF